MHTNTIHSPLFTPRALVTSFGRTIHSLLRRFPHEKSYRRVGKTARYTHGIPT